MPGPGRVTIDRVTIDRVTIETTVGEVLAGRTNPRASLAGHDLDTIERNTIHD
jgi:hypothetical protein